MAALACSGALRLPQRGASRPLVIKFTLHLIVRDVITHYVTYVIARTLNSVSLKLTYPAYLMKKLLLEHLEHTVAKVYSCWVTWHAIQDTQTTLCRHFLLKWPKPYNGLHRHFLLPASAPPVALGGPSAAARMRA